MRSKYAAYLRHLPYKAGRVDDEPATDQCTLYGTRERRGGYEFSVKNILNNRINYKKIKQFPQISYELWWENGMLSTFPSN